MMKNSVPRKRVAFVFGTRPEVTKLAPVILAMQPYHHIQPILISTGQHDELFAESLQAFGLTADKNLHIMRHHQSLSQILGRALQGLDNLYKSIKPNFTIVLGDALSTFAATLVSFYYRIPVAHIEAGMRTGKLYEPFPEEANRRLITNLSQWFFPATAQAKRNLLDENVPQKNIFLVGSTEVDALKWILQNHSSPSIQQIIPKRFHRHKNLVVITTHRRESWGKPLEEVFTTIRILALRYRQFQFIHSAHPNPLVSDTAKSILHSLPNVLVLKHIPFIPFTHLLSQADLIMTDSGGVQVDTACLKKPVLILRDVTEWPEIVDGGLGKLVGTKKDRILESFASYVSKKWPKKNTQEPIYPDGAAKKIADIIANILEV